MKEMRDPLKPSNKLITVFIVLVASFTVSLSAQASNYHVGAGAMNNYSPSVAGFIEQNKKLNQKKKCKKHNLSTKKQIRKCRNKKNIKLKKKCLNKQPAIKKC
jgi:hypothetical protein